MAVNYGLDSVRFIQPVKVNSKVRLNVTLTDVTEKKPGQWLFKATATLEIEGQENPLTSPSRCRLLRGKPFPVVRH